MWKLTENLILKMSGNVPKIWMWKLIENVRKHKMDSPFSLFTFGEQVPGAGTGTRRGNRPQLRGRVGGVSGAGRTPARPWNYRPLLVARKVEPLVLVEHQPDPGTAGRSFVAG